MTQNAFGFDLQSKDVAEQASGGDFSPLPAGWYDVTVDRAEGTQSQAGHDMLKLTFRVKTGDYEGRLVFSNLVYGHDKETPRNIAQGQMAKIAQIAEINPTSPEGFAGARVGIKVSEVPAKGSYPAGNDVKAIGPVPEPGASPGKAEATSSGKKKQPWD